MKNLKPGNMAQAMLQAQKMKKELEKIKSQIKKEKFAFESEKVKLVINGDYELLELTIKSNDTAKELEKEISKAFKAVKKDLEKYTSTALEPFGQLKDFLS